MSFTRFFSWLSALVLAAGGSLVVVRYGFDTPDWGADGFWMVLATILFTRTIQDALEDMWTRDDDDEDPESVRDATPAAVGAGDEEDE